MTTPTDPLVAVSEAAREAAANLGVKLGWAPDRVAAMRAGELDYWPTAQAFARFEASISHHAASEAAVRQNDAMRQELAHVGNLVSDLARAMGVDQANDDGTWPDLPGRIRKLIASASSHHAGMREALEPFAKCADEIDYEDSLHPERDPTPDDEWAKFRLTAGDYRRARDAFAVLTQQGEFQRGSEATRDLNETVRSVSADIALFAACCAVSEKHDPNWTGIKAKAEEWVFDLRAALASIQPPQELSKAPNSDILGET